MEYIDYAEIAYIQDPGEMLAALPAGEARLIRVPRTETEGYVLRLPDGSGIAAFSGTESLGDIARDAMFLPARYSGGWLHRGFRDAIRSIETPVRMAVRELKLIQVTCIGHSLGAELALGCMDIIGCGRAWGVTFGCPNGWSPGAAAAHATRHPGRVTHYQNRWDYVTWMQSITTGRPPGQVIRLQGPAGHSLRKYRIGLALLGR